MNNVHYMVSVYSGRINQNEMKTEETIFSNSNLLQARHEALTYAKKVLAEKIENDEIDDPSLIEIPELRSIIQAVSIDVWLIVDESRQYKISRDDMVGTLSDLQLEADYLLDAGHIKLDDLVNITFDSDEYSVFLYDLNLIFNPS